MEFSRLPYCFWQNKSFQKEFMENLAKKLSIQSDTDWAKISIKKFKQEGGSGLLKYYNNSLHFALLELYPERFESLFFEISARLPRGFWSKQENHKKYLDWFANKNNIDSASKWSTVSTNDIKKAGGTCLLNQYSSFFECLQISKFMM